MQPQAVWTTVIYVSVFVAALSATAFPVLYAFSPWYKSTLGRALMLQGIAFAAALDLTIIFSLFPSDGTWQYVVAALIYLMIAVATSYLAFMMCKFNYKRGKTPPRSTLVSVPTPDYDPKHAEPKKPLLSDRLYDKLKPTTTVVLPALVTFWLALAGIWHIEHADQVAGTLGSLNVFLGALLLLSSKAYNKSDARFDGSIDVSQHEDGTKLFSLNLDAHPETIESKDSITFKVNPSSEVSPNPS